MGENHEHMAGTVKRTNTVGGFVGSHFRISTAVPTPFGTGG